MTNFSPDAPSPTERLEQFAANVAHDFNNLLTGILGNLELMQNRAARTKVTAFDSYLEGARNAGARAATFAQRLLAFSGRAAQDPVPVAIGALVQDVADSLRERAVNVTVESAGGPVMVLCDPGQAELTLHELLDNAADAVAQGGEIRIGYEIAGPRVRVTVRDTGAGMTPEVLARATGPFFTTRPNGAGKGLGLPIADRFARHAGGSLEITSAPGTGTTVALLLPMAG
jgi:signal transduction histidine kinase